MICKNCKNEILDGSKICPFCGKKPNKEIAKNKAESSGKGALGNVKYPTAFMLVFIILGVLTIIITLIVHLIIVGSKFSFASIARYCITPIKIGIILILIGIIIRILAIKKVREAFGKVLRRPRTAIVIGIALLAIGGFLAIRGFSYQESETSKYARLIKEEADYYGASAMSKGAEKLIDGLAGTRALQGLGGSILAIIGIVVTRAGIKSQKEKAVEEKANAEAARLKQIEDLKRGRIINNNNANSNDENNNGT